MDRRVIICKDLDDPRSFHHPHAVIAGQLIFVSGLVAKRDEVGNVSGTSHAPDGTITHDVMVQFGSIVETLKQILRDADSDLSMVVDVTVFMSDIKRDFTRFNASYGTVFGDCLPSRTTVEVSRFPSEVCIELKVVAMRNDS